MSEQRRCLHTALIAVRWGDMDALGHVNNAAYFTYMEQTRIAWLEHTEAGTLRAQNEQGCVIVNAACTFHKPVLYPATLKVEMYGGPAGRSSFESTYELTDADSAEHYASGSARIVWMDYLSGRSAPLPDFIRRLLPAG